MAYILVGSTDTIQLQLPSKGTTNWEQTLRLGTFQPLAIHDHVHNVDSSGNNSGNRGAPITDLAILLQNGGYLKGRNADNTANISILKINADNKPELEPHICQEVNSTLTLAIDTTTARDITGTDVFLTSQCVIIAYSLKRTAGDGGAIGAILMGHIFLDRTTIKVTENSGVAAILSDGGTPFIHGTEIQFSVGTNKLHVENNTSVNNTYTLYLHITRLG